MSELQAVIFDFDGVLANSIPAYRSAVAEAAGQAGIDDPDAGQIASSDTRTVARRIIEQYDLEIDTETLAEQIENFALDRLLTTPHIVPGAVKLVSAIRQAGLRTAIASLAPRRNIEAVLRQGGMADYFEAIVAAEDIVNIKPNPEVFLKAAEALDLAGRDCLAIEDSPTGLTAANDAGMVTVALTTTVPADRLGHAHYIAGSLAELTLEKLNEIYLAHRP